MKDPLLVERMVVGDLETNAYLLADTRSGTGYIIDPGDDFRRVQKRIDASSIRLLGVINTHGHFDHIRADHCFSVPVLIHELDVPLLRDPALNFSQLFPPPYTYSGDIVPLHDGQELPLGGYTLTVLHTPGHTPGGISLVCDKRIFSGDTLFYHSVGRTDMRYADHRKLLASIRDKLFTFSDEYVVYPGHGEETTIGDERAHNPFIHE